MSKNLKLIETADYVHIDVMDGHFVSEKTIDHETVAKIKTSLVKDVHLMIENPEFFFQNYVDAGANIITSIPFFLSPLAKLHIDVTTPSLFGRNVSVNIATFIFIT